MEIKKNILKAAVKEDSTYTVGEETFYNNAPENLNKELITELRNYETAYQINMLEQYQQAYKGAEEIPETLSVETGGHKFTVDHENSTFSFSSETLYEAGISSLIGAAFEAAFDNEEMDTDGND